jgi:hypothetical protein
LRLQLELAGGEGEGGGSELPFGGASAPLIRRSPHPKEPGGRLVGIPSDRPPDVTVLNPGHWHNLNRQNRCITI